jgi:hypothetical protein
MNTRRRTLSRAIVGVAYAKGAWNFYTAHRSMEFMNVRNHVANVDDASESAAKLPLLHVVVPMLHEGEHVAALMEHWDAHIARSVNLRLVCVTTERENVERRDNGARTWEVLQKDPIYERLQAAGRARWIHYEGVNRTYAEQLGFGLNEVCGTLTDETSDYVYLANVDSRITDRGIMEIEDLIRREVPCAQQSALFLANFDELSGVAAAEALFQSRWTVEREVFRYLVGGGMIRWIPTAVRNMWYQHAVGHGFLISIKTLREIGGLPQPLYGLEDSALGFALRASGHAISPMNSLECADAPMSVRELARQRATWVRGPLGVIEYSEDLSRDGHLVMQGLYDGLKWSLGLPVLLFVAIVVDRRRRSYLLLALWLEMYLPLIRLLAGLRSLDLRAECRPSRKNLIAAVLLYPLAQLSYWLGGLRGLLGITIQARSGRPFHQIKTAEQR